jgi:hypothetical protein
VEKRRRVSALLPTWLEAYQFHIQGQNAVAKLAADGAT